MRYMGWDYPALLACPLAYLPVIEEVAREDRDRAAARARARR